MDDRFSCDSKQLKLYSDLVMDFYKNQVTRLKQLKKKWAGVEWYDDVSDDFVTRINDILAAITAAIATLCNGSRVTIIDDLLPLVEAYLQTSQDFK